MRVQLKDARKEFTSFSERTCEVTEVKKQFTQKNLTLFTKDKCHNIICATGTSTGRKDACRGSLNTTGKNRVQTDILRTMAENDKK